MPYVCPTCCKNLTPQTIACLTGGGLTYSAVPGCIGGIIAFTKANLALSSAAEVVMYTGAGLGIGSLLAAGSVCIACGIDRCRDEQGSSASSQPGSLPVAAAQNPLNRLRPSQQEQMDMNVPLIAQNMSPSPRNHHMNVTQPFHPTLNSNQNPMTPFNRPSAPNFLQHQHRIQPLPPLSPPSTLVQTPPHNRPRSLSTPPYSRQLG